MAKELCVDKQQVRLVLEHMRTIFSGVDGKELLHKILIKNEPNLINKVQIKCETAEAEVQQGHRASLEEKLMETLKFLSDADFDRFKDVLQQRDMKGVLPRIPRHRMKTSHRAELVELMMEVYGRQSVEVTREVLETMDRRHLALRLSHISSGSKERPSGSLELQAGGNVKQHCSAWTKLQPEVSGTETDEAPTYSLQSAAGAFECSVSGLRWVCQEKVTFKYRFCSCEEPLQRMKDMDYVPAGPLMDVTVAAGRFDEVFLPHWIHIKSNPSIRDKFAVLTVDDCGDVVEKASEVTASHVKLSDPSFSMKMVLVRVGLSVGINCKVLIYKTNTAFLTLHVYLIPPDPGLQQELDKKKLSQGYEIIQKPYPEEPLTMNDRFILTADLDAAEIYPERLMLRYESRDPNFFEVFIENPNTNFKLNLRQEDERRAIWSCDIRKNEYQTTKAEETDGAPTQPGCSGTKHFVDEHQVALTEKVNNMGVILDELLHHRVLGQETYDRVRALPSSREKMRELYSGPLRAGTACKDVFHRILEENEPFLIAELRRRK